MNRNLIVLKSDLNDATAFISALVSTAHRLYTDTLPGMIVGNLVAIVAVMGTVAYVLDSCFSMVGGA